MEQIKKLNMVNFVIVCINVYSSLIFNIFVVNTTVGYTVRTVDPYGPQE